VTTDGVAIWPGPDFIRHNNYQVQSVTTIQPICFTLKIQRLDKPVGEMRRFSECCIPPFSPPPLLAHRQYKLNLYLLIIPPR